MFLIKLLIVNKIIKNLYQNVFELMLKIFLLFYFDEISPADQISFHIPHVSTTLLFCSIHTLARIFISTWDPISSTFLLLSLLFMLFLSLGAHLLCSRRHPCDRERMDRVPFLEVQEEYQYLNFENILISGF